MENVLIIDDDPGFGRMLAEVVKIEGHKASWAIDLASGLDMARRVLPCIVFLDVHLPDGNGLEAIEALHDVASRPEIIVVTGLVEAESAEQAIQRGAWDYIEKTSTALQLALSLKRALRYRDATQAGVNQLKRESIAGDGRRMTEVLAVSARAARGDLPVLITGETGTGKELFARLIHENSARGKGALITVDCAALPENLVESVLFGHIKGAFTGAESSSEGLIRAADGGTLFLDEIGELTLHVQKAFLRVLQERCFRPVGGKSEVKSDFRLIAATNRDLGLMVSRGGFREDLLFRLRSIDLRLPPLRDHLEDLPALIEQHLRQAGDKYAASPELLAELRLHSWPGNVRELFQVLGQAVANAGKDEMLYPDHLPAHIRAVTLKARFGERLPQAHLPDCATTLDPQTLPLYRDYREQVVLEAEAHYLRALFQAAEGSPKRACELSGLSRTRVYCLAKAHGIRTGRGD